MNRKETLRRALTLLAATAGLALAAPAGADENSTSTAQAARTVDTFTTASGNEATVVRRAVGDGEGNASAVRRVRVVDENGELVGRGRRGATRTADGTVTQTRATQRVRDDGSRANRVGATRRDAEGNRTSARRGAVRSADGELERSRTRVRRNR